MRYRAVDDPAINNPKALDQVALQYIKENRLKGARTDVVSSEELGRSSLFSTKKEASKKLIEFVQAVVKDHFGVGKPIPVFQFVAPFDSRDQCAFYRWKQMEPDLVLLKQGRLNDYMHKQCLKIGYYLQKVRHIEIL